MNTSYNIDRTIIRSFYSSYTVRINDIKTEKNKSISELAKLESLKIVELFEETIRNTKDLTDTDLTAWQISTINENAGSVMKFNEFIKKNPIKDLKEATLLGSSFNHLIIHMDEVFASRDWVTAYKNLTGGLVANTPEFMRKLTKEGKPIIFLLPQNLSLSPTTHEEIKWLVAHPEMMKNVHIIYGMYDIFKSHTFGLISAKYNQKEIEEFADIALETALIQLVKHYK